MDSGGVLWFLLQPHEECSHEPRVMHTITVEVGVARHAIQVGVVGLRGRSVSSVATGNLVMWAESRGVVSTPLARHVEDGLRKTLSQV